MTQRQPNLVDKLMGLVPGWRGYSAREDRRHDDRRLREHVAEGLDAGKRHLRAVGRDLTDAGDIDQLAELDRLERALGRCADTLRHVEGGATGLMDRDVVLEEDLDRAYRHDLALLERARAVTSLLETLRADSDAASWREGRAAVDGLQTAIDERTAVLRGTGTE